MDKFTGLFIKANGEYQLHGKLDADVEGKLKTLREMTDNGGKIGYGRAQVTAEKAFIVHSVKGIIKSRNLN